MCGSRSPDDRGYEFIDPLDGGMVDCVLKG
jgi:hypothetical protein